jgi:hypothetical protein
MDPATGRCIQSLDKSQTRRSKNRADGARGINETTGTNGAKVNGGKVNGAYESNMPNGSTGADGATKIRTRQHPTARK